MINSNFDFNQKISSSLALMLIMVMSFAVAWFSLSAGEKIVSGFEQSKTYNSSGKEVK